jgi:hypothetical protein
VHRLGVKRIWDFSKQGGDGGAPGAATQAPPPPPQSGQQLVPPAPNQMPPGPMGPPVGPDGEDLGDEMPERYLARPIRPVAQLAVRVGLWGAVILGCAGGIRALVLPAGADSEDPVTQDIGDADIMVPATVAGVAEDVVQAWMTATTDDQETLNRLFVDPPSVDELDNRNITLVDLRTVSGERIQDGYWTVTVATDLIETDPSAPPPDPESGEQDEAQQIDTWYVEVGIVGDAWGGMAALSTPAVVPAPALAETRLEPDIGDEYEPEGDDELGQAVDGFLTALVAGDGELDRYLSAESDEYRDGIPLEAANPAPFVDIEVLQLAWTELNEDDIRVWAQVRATTATETTRVVAYEIVVREAVDRYEVLNAWGAPTVRPIPEERDSEAPSGQSDDSSTTTTEGDSGDSGSSGDSSSDSSSADDGGSEPDGSPPPDEGGSTGEDTGSTDTTIELPAE